MTQIVLGILIAAALFLLGYLVGSRGSIRWHVAVTPKDAPPKSDEPSPAKRPHYGI